MASKGIGQLPLFPRYERLISLWPKRYEVRESLCEEAERVQYGTVYVSHFWSLSNPRTDWTRWGGMLRAH